jgi:4-hydroxybenzoate polyprenyltransferase
MHSLKFRILEMKPAFTLFYLSFMAFFCIVAVQKYLGLAFDPLICMCFMGIVFSIYTLNRFTDAAEDFTNDIGKFLFFQRKKVFFILAVAALTGSIGTLLIKEKLNWLYFLLLASGFTYSYRLIPWYSKKAGLHLIRIKEMTLVKNLAVSFLWAASVMGIPILYSSIPISNGFTIMMIGIGMFISTLNNTLFDDIMDEPGDRVAGIKTLPTVWGSRRSLAFLWVLDAVWLTVIAGCWLAGLIDGIHGAFLALLGSYPFLYMGLFAGGKAPKSWVDFLSESDLLLFAIGMMLLSIA